MHRLILIVIANMSLIGFSQTYFQQKVDYTIQVELNDVENTLSAYEEFSYQNNSPDELSFIYVHLWPNAYKNENTALGEQLYGMGNDALSGASEDEKGWIDSLNFKVNGEPVKWELEEDIDICKLTLNKALQPGEIMKVSTPFKVKIPSGSISRLGHVGESFQITQWYPKPAVYDVNGWHQFPYLTQGEFYSEYGTFDVSITLPKNYVVGATGDLQTESEIEFLNQRAESTNEKFKNETFKSARDSNFPDSEKEMKTIRYTQKDVHDFGWFADKRFEVLKGEVELPNSSRKVTSWAMFVPHHAELWKDAIEYLNDATFYYSKWNGDYPYNQVTAVDGTISAGGGMEYPNVTVIGNASSKEELEVVIVHEVGHNWFYGLLGSNERDHAWMDEGLNTLNEIRYVQTKYPENTRMSDLAGGIADKIHLEKLSHHDMADMTYRFVASHGLDQPIELHSADYSSLNYGAIVYSKTGLVFTYLKDYLGDELFDKSMKAYYDKWHYKHPQPEDLKKILEEESGKELSWLFNDLIQTTKQVDFKVKKVKMKDGTTLVDVRNVGQVDSPIRVDAYSLGQYRESVWIEPGSKKPSATFKGTTFDSFVIDANKQMPEINRNNNYWTKKGLLHRTEPFKLELLAGDNEGNKWNNFWLPAFGLNVYDKFMLGAIFHNQTIPKNKFEYTIAPLYSFGRKTISGFADLNYAWLPAKNIRKTTLGISTKTFGNGLVAQVGPDPVDNDLTGTYITIQPYLDLQIGKPKAKTYFKQGLNLKGHYILESGELRSSNLTGGSLKYNFKYNRGVHDFAAKVKFDYYNVINSLDVIEDNLDLLNAGLTLEYKLSYWEEKGKELELRFFAGQNLFYNGTEDGRYGYSLGGQSGTQDVTYEQYLFGRNETNGFWSNQRIENQGGFKTVSGFGVTNGSLFSTNVVAEIPFIPLLVAYADYGLFDNGTDFESASDAGLGIRIRNKFSVYFPLYESSNIINAYEDGTRYAEKIRFTLDLTGLKIGSLISNAL